MHDNPQAATELTFALPDHRVIALSGRDAATTVRLRLTVDDTQVAEQRLRLTLVEERGWFVCDVERIS